MSYLRSYHEILAIIDAIDPVAYAKTRNHLSGAVTRLSPYISRGVVSLPVVRDRLLERHSQKDCQKLIQELAWREYFQRVWWEQGDDIFSELRFSRNDWRHTGLVSALVNGETGIAVLDAAVRELEETGYLHNHNRMWVASVACNLAYAHWHDMGRWMFYHLIDGDPASNFCSWQWVAGTSVNKRYTVNQALINACSDSEQTGTFLDYEREELGAHPVPDVLRASEPFTLAPGYPAADTDVVDRPVVHLYTPWTLDPQWRREETAQRILIIDPTFFNRYPGSADVFDFIVRQGKTVIPELQVFIGRPHELHGIGEADEVRAIAHPTNRDWLVQFDEPQWLFPEVSGYYPSFFKYWQAVTKVHSFLR